MFFLKLNNEDLKRILVFAEKMGIPGERAARVAFLEGMRLLAKPNQRQKGKREKEIREKIKPKEFERMLVHDGYTMAEYVRLKHLNCTRQRLEQVAIELGLKHSPGDRSPEWKMRRRARKLGNHNLLNRKWMMTKLSQAVSLDSLAATLKISHYDLTLFMREHDLVYSSVRRQNRNNSSHGH